MIAPVMPYINKAINLFRGFITFRKAISGNGISVCRGMELRGPEYMSIGDNCYFGPNCRIEAWNRYNSQTYSPSIEIGNNVHINSTCHIGSINRITIEDDCLFGSHVMLIDHAHGTSTYNDMLMHPSKRDLYSKGSIVIGRRCWLCENVVVLPSVHIGEGCIIGANSVVTKDVPPFSVAVGNPAIVVKRSCSQ